MKTTTLRLLHKKPMTGDIALYTFLPEHPYIFVPGQYCFLRNPQYLEPNERHAFSIVSTPSMETVQFCIRSYGPWTTAFQKLEPGDTVEASEAQGTFIHYKHQRELVLFAGGVGVSPIVSILRDLADKQESVNIVMFYGSRDLDSILFKQELDKLSSQLPHCRIIHILSEVSEEYKGPEQKGFITAEVVQRELVLSPSQYFFVSGPPVFITKIREMLLHQGIEQSKIIDELDIRSKF